MTTAGHGARQQQEAARRSVQDAERRLAAAKAREHAWSAGAAGEEQVAVVLAGLEQLGWVVMHDVAWPGRPRANLDHVLVGPGGVLIVDTKNWSGTVTVDAARGLRSSGYRKTKEVDAVETARQAVLPLVPDMPPAVVTGVICLAAQAQDPVRLLGGVTVVGRTQLQQHVCGLPTVLSTQAITDAAISLGAALRRPLDRVPAQGSRTPKPKGSPRTRRRGGASGRGTAVKLGLLGLLIGAFMLFPDQVMKTYMSLVSAVVTPVTDDLVDNLQDGVTPTPDP